jgi:uncharacterized protein YcfL
MKRALTLFAMSIVTLAGCQNDPTKAPGAAGVDPLPADQYPKVEAAGGLSPHLVISGANVTPGTETKPMSVTSAVRSTWDKNVLSVQWRYFFFDEKGTPLDTDPDWRFARLPPRSQVFMEGFAPDTNARDWRLQIRPAQ